MKRIARITAILMVLAFLFSGCQGGQKTADVSKDKDVLTQLNTMKEQGKKPKELFDYINQNIREMQKSKATEAVGSLTSFLEENEAVYNEKLFAGENPDLMIKYFHATFDHAKIESIKEPEFKELLYDITLGGYRIVEIEGSFMVTVDYDALKTFQEYIDDEMKEYINILALRYNDPVIVDASLQVGPEELEKRILQMENYLLSYNNEMRKEIVLSMYEGHIMMYMSGSDNTPIFDYDTGAMSPTAFNTLEKAARNNKETAFGKTMAKYVELLKQEGFANTEKVQDFIVNVDGVLMEQLEQVEKK